MRERGYENFIRTIREERWVHERENQAKRGVRDIWGVRGRGKGGVHRGRGGTCALERDGGGDGSDGQVHSGRAISVTRFFILHCYPYFFLYYTSCTMAKTTTTAADDDDDDDDDARL